MNYYRITQSGPHWTVWINDDPVAMSNHGTQAEAEAAVRRYTTSDNRKAK